MGDDYDPTRTYPSFSYNDWTRLKDTLSAIKAAQQAISENKEKLYEFISKDEERRNYSSLIHSKQVRLRLYEEKIKLARTRVRNIRFQLNLAMEENELKENQFQSNKTDVEKSDHEIRRIENETSDLKFSLIKLLNELVYRRRWMLNELYKIYFLNDQFYRVFKRQCTCEKFDVIRGLHLPRTVARLGHREEELCAALGHIVNLLSVMSRIINYPLKFPVYFQGSRSNVYDRYSNEVFPLYIPNVRSQKGRFDQSLAYLNKNLVQLRADCGLETREVDRAVDNLKELILVMVGRVNHTTNLSPPTNNLYSPSTIIPKPATTQPNPEAEFVERMQRLMLEGPEKPSEKPKDKQESSIIDVISSRYDSFSIPSGERRKTSRQELVPEKIMDEDL